MRNSLRKDQNLDEILKSLKIPKHEDGLSHRIISEAALMPQYDRLLNIFQEFKLPAPAYSMAVVLVLGFIVGYDGTFVDLSAGFNFDDTPTISALETLFAEDTLL